MIDIFAIISNQFIPCCCCYLLQHFRLQVVVILEAVFVTETPGFIRLNLIVCVLIILELSVWYFLLFFVAIPWLAFLRTNPKHLYVIYLSTNYDASISDLMHLHTAHQADSPLSPPNLGLHKKWSIFFSLELSIKAWLLLETFTFSCRSLQARLK